MLRGMIKQDWWGRSRILVLTSPNQCRNVARCPLQREKNKKILNPESWPSMRTMPGSQKTYRGPSSTTALVIACDLRTPEKIYA